MDIWLPDYLRQAQTSLRYIDSTGRSRGAFNGYLKSAAKGGDRLGLIIQFTKHGGQTTTGRSEKAILRSFVARLRGGQNRALARDLSYRRRGSFPTGELLPNNTFSNSTTGWSSNATYSAIAVADRLLRSTRIHSVAGSGGPFILQPAAITVTPYAPYVMRFFLLQGRGDYTTDGVGIFDGVASENLGGTGLYGMFTRVTVPRNATLQAGLYDGQGNIALAGDYLSIPYASLSRCALADAAPNLLLRSNAFGTSPWTLTNATSGTNNTGAPDGSGTDQFLQENNTNGLHNAHQSVTISSAAADYAISCSVKAGTRNFFALELQEATGSTSVRQFFNTSTGAVLSASPGANWSNVRTFVRDQGDGWRRFTLIARKTNAATSMTAFIEAASADGTLSYTGTTSAVPFYPWHASVAQSSVPVRDALTTSAATTGETLSGSAICLKGLPASTSGLLAIDDQVEITTSRGPEPKFVTASLDSDAAGLGYLQFEPPLRFAPADNAPVIIHEPMGRFAYADESPGWENDPGFWSSASCDLEEA